MADNKFAAYICSGCGIGDVLNVGALERIAQKEGKMAMRGPYEKAWQPSRSNPYLPTHPATR